SMCRSERLCGVLVARGSCCCVELCARKKDEKLTFSRVTTRIRADLLIISPSTKVIERPLSPRSWLLFQPRPCFQAQAFAQLRFPEVPHQIFSIAAGPQPFPGAPPAAWGQPVRPSCKLQGRDHISPEWYIPGRVLAAVVRT